MNQALTIIRDTGIELTNGRNPCRLINGICHMLLTQSQISMFEFMYWELVRHSQWCAKLNKSGNWHAYTMVTVDGRRRTLYLHRLILGLDFGDKRHGHHVDGNPLNNVGNNLQILSVSHHGFTMLMPTNKPATLVRVTKSGTYRRRSIRAEDGTRIRSKTFKTLEEAIENRDLLLQLHRPNFPLPEGAV